MNKFRYKSAGDLLGDSRSRGYELPWRNDMRTLFQPLAIGGIETANRLLIHPMEGFDSTPKGEPDELTYRRYDRFAKGGSGLVWIEATSVNEGGKSNPRQLTMNKDTLSSFCRFIDQMKHSAKVAGSQSKDLRTIIQLTHSGKYAHAFPKGSKDLTDDDLKYIRDAHIAAALLAQKAGIDGVDVKICHGYLLHELISDRSHNDSVYRGKPLDNRIRLAAEILEGIRQTAPGLLLAVRLNIFDGLPGGFGTDPLDERTPDFSEVEQVLQHSQMKAVDLWSVTSGIPYINPWLTRPYDKPAIGVQDSPEHPIQGVIRMIELAARAKSMTSKPVVCAGLSWLREFLPYVAEGIVQDQLADLIGIGRMAFAYPDLANDLFQSGAINKRKVCVACSGCTNRIRQGNTAGCIIRDREIYA